MLNKVKQFLRIDADMTDDDTTLSILIQSAIQDLESSTNKSFDEDNELMITYIMLQTKLLYEMDSNPALLRAINSIGNQIKVSTDFDERITTPIFPAPPIPPLSGGGSV